MYRLEWSSLYEAIGELDWVNLSKNFQKSKKLYKYQ